MARAVVNRMANMPPMDKIIDFVVDNNFAAVQQRFVEYNFGAYNWDAQKLKNILNQWYLDGYNIDKFLTVPYLNDTPNYTGGYYENNTNQKWWEAALQIAVAVIPVLAGAVLGNNNNNTPTPPPPPPKKDYTLYIMGGVGAVLLTILLIVIIKRK